MAEEVEKAQEGEKDPWQLKDGLVVIPLLASALAMTWEVGFFLRIKGSAFGFFSIAEHITFALQALPLAMLVATLIGWSIVQNSLLQEYVLPKIAKSRVGEEAFHNWLAIFGFVVGTFITVAAIYSRTSATYVVTGIMFTSFFGLYFGRRLFGRSFLVIFLSTSVFAFTFAIGFDTARNEILSERPPNKIEIGEKGKPTDKTLDVRIMRSGERGVLYFDPAKRAFGLIPWESVKRIDWEISPLMTP